MLISRICTTHYLWKSSVWPTLRDDLTHIKDDLTRIMDDQVVFVTQIDLKLFPLIR